MTPVDAGGRYTVVFSILCPLLAGCESDQSTLRHNQCLVQVWTRSVTVPEQHTGLLPTVEQGIRERL